MGSNCMRNTIPRNGSGRKPTIEHRASGGPRAVCQSSRPWRIRSPSRPRSRENGLREQLDIDAPCPDRRVLEFLLFRGSVHSGRGTDANRGQFAARSVCWSLTKLGLTVESSLRKRRKTLSYEQYEIFFQLVCHCSPSRFLAGVCAGR